MPSQDQNQVIAMAACSVILAFDALLEVSCVSRELRRKHSVSGLCRPVSSIHLSALPWPVWPETVTFPPCPSAKKPWHDLHDKWKPARTPSTRLGQCGATSLTCSFSLCGRMSQVVMTVGGLLAVTWFCFFYIAGTGPSTCYRQLH